MKNGLRSVELKLSAQVKALVLLALGLGLSGCLTTRQQLREWGLGPGVPPSSAPTAEKKTATSDVIARDISSSDSNYREVQSNSQTVARQNMAMQAYDEQLKDLRNRLDQLEHQIALQNQQTLEKSQSDESGKKFQAYEEALKSLETQIQTLVTEVQSLKKKDDEKSKVEKGSVKKTTDFDRGENLFEDKEWKEAILAYQSYRDKNPKGKNYAEATYKMGVCFQELSLKDEAKVFYNEVISKFPNSSESRRASYRLKNIK
ncbi:MAG: tetratricopeptide repeat protein [Bdellovibrionales bacterium]|nr:tetratricopeptide repeat protein [Bdellovibrionales bacterium]